MEKTRDEFEDFRGKKEKSDEGGDSNKLGEFEGHSNGNSFDSQLVFSLWLSTVGSVSWGLLYVLDFVWGESFCSLL